MANNALCSFQLFPQMFDKRVVNSLYKWQRWGVFFLDAGFVFMGLEAIFFFRFRIMFLWDWKVGDGRILYQPERLLYLAKLYSDFTILKLK